MNRKSVIRCGWLCILLLITGCTITKDENFVAEVNGQKISIQEIDGMVRNSLYEYLFAIYNVRKISLDELINQRLLNFRARRHRISTDSVLSIGIAGMKKKISIDSYIRNNSLHYGVVDEKNPFKLIPLKTAEGQRILHESYLNFLRNEYIQELRKESDIRIYLKPPITPKLDLAGVEMKIRGDVAASNSITVISDFNCPVCREKQSLFEELYKDYKDKLRFEYIHLSSSVTKSMVFAECAAKQNRFWSAYDVLFKKAVTDTASAIGLIAELQLSKDECLSCLFNTYEEKRLTLSMDRLRAIGIEATPTILVNHKIYYGELTANRIRQFIETSLER
ncbi:thioredoxin domain-containing protein [Dyadobacter bucti]|uniref:thioredoxin domain-containing protein n=1 Tax=Dyadobacter bucti TaxID=2572203 RepID=UPI001109E8C0|nr:thioredoxin domain-containing protein [Dyadobacter bucti]